MNNVDRLTIIRNAHMTGDTFDHSDACDTCYLLEILMKDGLIEYVHCLQLENERLSKIEKATKEQRETLRLYMSTDSTNEKYLAQLSIRRQEAMRSLYALLGSLDTLLKRDGQT